MNKNELISLVSKRTEIPKSKCEKVMNELKSTIMEVCLKGGNVTLRNFGKFSLQEKKARKFLNPQTKRYYLCQPKKVIAFKSFDSFKYAISK